jgi:hypothetical protein
MHTRLTAVLRREDERWKVVHMHVSVGVPDEEVSDLQERWATDRSGHRRPDGVADALTGSP